MGIKIKDNVLNNNKDNNNIIINKNTNINSKELKGIIYYLKSTSSDGDDEEDENQSLNPTYNYKNKRNNDLLKHFFPDILKAIGNRAIKDTPTTLKELEQYLQNYIQEISKRNFNDTTRLENNKISNNDNIKTISSSSSVSYSTDNSSSYKENDYKKDDDNISKRNHNNNKDNNPSAFSNKFKLNFNFENADFGGMPIVTELIQKGYLTDSNKWLKKKGFLKIGQEFLAEIIKSLKKDQIGMHESKFSGSGNIIEEQSKKYDRGDEIGLININATINNFIERQNTEFRRKGAASNTIRFPLDISYEDLEIYESKKDIQISTVYCIDLSSTMRYSSMYNNLSRIEAAKRALWSLYILNKKFFPLDSIYIIGFGSVASKINIFDIPFLRTFDPNADFLHYTNYQAAYRLAKKILIKDGSKNKRIVMITDGHPSACFIDNANEKNKIMKQRPYSHFYLPDQSELTHKYSKKNNIQLDIKEKQIVYLCYRYRQIDQYIGEQTIKEAKKMHNSGIAIDTIMVSEEDTLLDFVNDLAKSVNGKSIYINPKDIDKILITDYLLNKKKLIK